MSKRSLFMRYVVLVFGFFFVALGIALAKHSHLGISPVSSIANVMSLKFDALSVGTWIMISNSVMILAQIALLRKKFKPLQLLQFPLSILLGVLTDLNLMIVSYIPNGLYTVRLTLVFVGVISLSIGISLMVISDTVMNVGEAMVSVIATLTRKNFGTVKVIFDVSCVTLSIILSLVFFDMTIVGTREGTVITALCTGFVVKWMTARLKGPITKLF